MKFAHLADCHLGSWRYPEMQELNQASFQKAIDICIDEKVEFILISGDLFDSAYPSIETLKSAFSEFKKIKDAKIPVYLIAGSHDYSVSGKTLLDVLETAGFCKNVSKIEEKDKVIMLQPTIEGNAAIYGYPGKKSGLEIQELRNIKFQDAPGFFKIFMLHTTIESAKGSLPIDSIAIEDLPYADYYALGHLHLDYCENRCVYPGPIFPNNFDEIEKLNHGRFYIIDHSNFTNLKKIELKLKKVQIFDIEIKDAFTAAEKIIGELKKHELEDKIILLKLKGKLERGKISNIDFHQIDIFLKEKKSYFFMRNTSQLKEEEADIKIEVTDIDKMEESIIENHKKANPNKFNSFIEQLIKTLEFEKKEDEKNIIFESRLMSDLKKILNF